MESNGSRLLELISDNGRDEVAVKVRHADRVGPGVGPIEMRVDPVDGQAVRRDNVMIDDDLLLVAFIDGRPTEIVVRVYEEGEEE